MLQEILFYIIILGTNIIQGITGFAGTVLAGVFIKSLLVEEEQILYMLLGIIVIGLAVKGLFTMDREEKGEVSFESFCFHWQELYMASLFQVDHF